MPHVVAGAPAALQGVAESVPGVQGTGGATCVQGVADCVQGGIAGRRPLRVFQGSINGLGGRGRRGLAWGGLLEPKRLRKVLSRALAPPNGTSLPHRACPWLLALTRSGACARPRGPGGTRGGSTAGPWFLGTWHRRTLRHPCTPPASRSLGAPWAPPRGLPWPWPWAGLGRGLGLGTLRHGGVGPAPARSPYRPSASRPSPWRHSVSALVQARPPRSRP